MSVTVLREGSKHAAPAVSQPGQSQVSEITPAEKAAVLSFLAARPLHTVLMASMIRDNGVVSSHNRGSFYVCRDRQNLLEGVALIGQVTVMESRSEESLSAFAQLMQHCSDARVIRGERAMIDSFLKHSPISHPRSICHELLLQQSSLPPQTEATCELRTATSDDLDQVLKINAALAFQESGASPFDRDPDGFHERTVRRIEQSRIWIWKPADKLIFKADIMAETSQAAYLEGIYVDADARMQGHGRRCMSQLARTLLRRTNSICLTVNERNKRAQAFYQKAGYQYHSHYQTVYLST